MSKKLAWRAIYDDGSIIDQYADNQEKSSETIDVKRLKIFKIVTIDGSKTIISVYKSDNQEISYRCRTSLNRVIKRLHIISINTAGVTNNIFIEDDMSSINVSEFNTDNNKLWYPIQ